MTFIKRYLNRPAFLPITMILGSQILFWVVFFLLSNDKIVRGPFSVLTAIVFGIFAGLVGLWGERTLSEKVAIRKNLDAEQRRSTILVRRIESMMELNRGLVKIQNEKELMDLALKVISQIAEVSYSSFVPLDEFENPLAAFTYAQKEETFLNNWAEHLVSQGVKNRCQTCLGENPDADHSCPLLQGPFTDTFTINCMALRNENRTLGVLNLYLHAGQHLAEDARDLIHGILDEIGFAVLSVRARNQEMTTLRHLQLARASRNEFSTAVETMLENAKNSLGLNLIQLRLIPGNIWPNGINFQMEDVHHEIGDLIDVAEKEAVRSGNLFYSDNENKDILTQAVIGLPILGISDQVLGTLICSGFSISSEQLERLKALGFQIGIMAQNESRLLDIEYQVVLEERNRLAREIHDGLAQTLAFLKMQTSQMQQSLSENDMVRLTQMLNQHVKILSEAYLDTRTAIDHLRMKPENDFGELLESLVNDFEKSSGIIVRTSFPEISWEMMPEVQAHIIRIIQEALNNVRKHANSKFVSINGYQWERDLILDVIDDGKGFTPEQILEMSQHGLRGMRERAELIGCDFQIISQPGKGTTIRLRLPQYEERAI